MDYSSVKCGYSSQGILLDNGYPMGGSAAVRSLEARTVMERVLGKA